MSYDTLRSDTYFIYLYKFRDESIIFIQCALKHVMTFVIMKYKCRIKYLKNLPHRQNSPKIYRKIVERETTPRPLTHIHVYMIARSPGLIQALQ